MLLSKDRQNLLKIISYDFIFVGIQVKDVKGKDLYQVQSYTSQLLYTFEKRCSPKPFGLTKNGLISGRLACTSSKTKINRNLDFNPKVSNYFRMFFCTKNLNSENSNP